MEIDERAGALAAFALAMKARAKDSRFLRRGVHPHIVVLRPIQFRDEELQPLLDGMVAALFDQAKARKEDRPPLREALLHDLHLWAEADNFGSLLRPRLTVEQIAAVRAQVTTAAASPQADLLVEEPARATAARAGAGRGAGATVPRRGGQSALHGQRQHQ